MWTVKYLSVTKSGKEFVQVLVEKLQGENIFKYVEKMCLLW